MSRLAKRQIIPLTPKWFAMRCLASRKATEGAKNKAAARLCRSLDPETLNRIIDVYDVLSPETKQAVRLAVRELENPQVADSLRRLLLVHPDDEGLCASAIAALGTMRTNATTARLVELLQNSHDHIRTHTVATLKSIGWSPSRADERTSFAFAQRNLRCVAHEGPDAVPFLTSVLSKYGWSTECQRAAIQCLYTIGSEPVLEPLVRATQHHNDDISRLAVKALQRLNNPRTGHFVVKAISKELHTSVFQALGTDIARNALADEDSWVRYAAARAALVIKDPRSIPQLIKILCNDTPAYGVRAASAALVAIGGAQVVDACNQLLCGANAEHRRRASSILRQLGWQPPDGYRAGLLAIAVEDYEMTKQINDVDIRRVDIECDKWRMRRAMECGDDGIRAIEFVLETEPDDYTLGRMVEGLSELGDLRTIPVLERSLRSPRQAAWAASYVALGRMKCPLPEFDQALWMITQRDFKGARSLGAACVQALVHVIHLQWKEKRDGSPYAPDALRLLDEMLKDMRAALPSQALERILALPDEYYIEWTTTEIHSDTGRESDERPVAVDHGFRFDCRRIKALARDRLSEQPRE